MIIVPSGTPIARAASTNSRCLRDMNSPRITRASHIQPKRPEKDDDDDAELPSDREKTISSRKMAGKASMMSTKRISSDRPSRRSTRQRPDDDPEQRRDQGGADADQQARSAPP